jgi:hypothetical protein
MGSWPSKKKRPPPALPPHRPAPPRAPPPAPHAPAPPPAPRLPTLPLPLLLHLCSRHLAARDLACLECAARTFRQPVTGPLRGALLPALRGGPGGEALGVCECAAEAQLARRSDGWRVVVQLGESHKFALHVLDSGLLASQPRLAAGAQHTLVTAGPSQQQPGQGAASLLAFGSDMHRQLGLGLPLGGGGGGGSAGVRWEAQQPSAVRLAPLPEPPLGVAAGATHSLCVGSSGALYSWGAAMGGQLGHADADAAE